MLRQLFSKSLSLSGSVRMLSSAAPATTGTVNKEALMKLRKRTGYSYINCKKALVEFGPERLDEAVAWLKELAKKEGWAKAAKLSSRATTQGLVGVKSSGNAAAVVELSCETDFVARGDNFKALLEQLTNAVLAHGISKNVESTGKMQTLTINPDEVMCGSVSFREVVSSAVGKLGENIQVRKTEVIVAPSGASVFAAAHPREGTEGVDMGKFVSLVALKRANVEGLFPTEKLAGQICQHIIGMRSESLGEAPQPKVVKEKTENVDSGKDELNDFFQGQTTEIDEDETALLRQAFMLNPSQTVYDYVRGHKAEIVDFARVELGGEKE